MNAPTALLPDDGRPMGSFTPDFIEDDDARGASAFDVRILVAMLRRNAVMIGITVVVALAVALITTLLATPRYTATASVQIEQEAERVLDTQDVQPVASYQDADRFLRTQIDILSSRAMAISVAERLKLFGSARFYTSMGSRPAAPGQGVQTASANREQTLSLLRKNLQVVLPRSSRVVEISFESADPKLSADIANAYSTNFISGNLQRKYNSSSYAREFLAQQLVEAKARLEESERAQNQYARAAGIIAPRNTGGNGDQGASGQSVTTASLLQTNIAYNTAKAARIGAEQRWRSAADGPAMNIPEVLSNPAIQDLVRQRATKAAELQSQSAMHRDDFPSVREAQSQLNELDAQVQSLARSIRTSLRDEYRTALRQEQVLSGQVGGLKDETLGEQDRSVRLNILAREVETNRTIYDGLLQRFKEVSAAAGVASNNISIIDTADPPLNPTSPRLSINLIFGMVAGLVLAALLVYLREEIDDAVRSPIDIERKLDLPVLGTIPRTPPDQDLLVALSQPLQPVTEAYAALRTALLYSTPHGLPRQLLVTSAQPAEGKSTTSYALATSIARLGRSVVIVDADLRRPSLHKQFAAPNQVGLSDLLVQSKTIDEVLQSTTENGPMLISSGPIPPSPTELLSGGSLPQVLVQLGERFDAVIVDGPPVLGLADAVLLAAQIEATLLIIESNGGYRGRTKGAMRRLRGAKAHLIGAVLTKFEAKKSGYAYEYGYEYYTYGSKRQGEGQTPEVTA